MNENQVPSKRRAKIVATLGPGSAAPDTILKLAETGVNVFRLNFSHGEHETHQRSYQYVRDAAEKLGRPLGILADMQGPKIRVGKFPEGSINLRFHGEYAVEEGADTTKEDTIPVPHGAILKALVVGDCILLDDGKLMLTVIEAGATIRVRAETPGVLSDRKGFTVQGKALPVPALTEKDKKDLAFACQLGVDFIALSFVQTREDLQEARALMDSRGRLIAKVEKPAAIDNLDDIVDEADGIMVARGDLGVEFPPEDVPVLQRRIVRSARAAGKPVIVATHMLESMVDSLAPTRAEASDVATAIYQGADAIMLSSETAVGRHPATAVAIMDRICLAVETDPDHGRSHSSFAPASAKPHRDADIIAEAISNMAELNECDFVFVSTAHISAMSRFSRARPQHRLITHSQDTTKLAHHSLFWGVDPLPVAGALSRDDLIEAIKTYLEGRSAKVACAFGDKTHAGQTQPENIAWELEVISF